MTTTCYRCGEPGAPKETRCCEPCQREIYQSNPLGTRWRPAREPANECGSQPEPSPPPVLVDRELLGRLDATVKLAAIGGTKAKYAQGRRDLANQLLPIVAALAIRQGGERWNADRAFEEHGE